MAFRELRRITIIFVYLALILLIALALFFLFRRDPTCSDGRRNQGEEGIDCGGPCRPCPEIIQLQPLVLGNVDWVHDIDNKYDVIVEITNPNDVYGAATLNFRLKAIFSEGNEVGQEYWEKNYILPGEKKLFFVHGFELEKEPQRFEAELEKDSETWKKFESFEEPNFVINNSRYEQYGAGNIDFGAAKGTVINRSTTDYETIDVHVVLRDERNEIIAINSQRMNTVRAGELRDYTMAFPHSFPGSVAKVEPFVETNPFDSANYIKTYGDPEIWDETMDE